MRKKDHVGYVMILPFFIIYIYFWLTPIFSMFFDSFTDYQLFGEKNFIGINNYLQIITDPVFRAAFTNTFVYAIGSLVPTMLIGFMLALLVNNKLLKTRFARTFLFLPHVLSMVAVSMVWLLIYDPAFGHANFILKFLGFDPIKWLQDPSTAMMSIIIMSVWKSLGYNMMINLSGLQNIPEELYEVANIEGATPLQRIRYIVIPLMTPTTFFLLITGLIGSFNVFEQVNVLTGGGPANATTTMVHQIYLSGLAYYDMGYASAQSVILVSIILIVTLLNYRFGAKIIDSSVG